MMWTFASWLYLVVGRWRLAEEWVGQARNQIAASRADGNRQVEWWFYEQSSAEFATELFSQYDDLKQIVIRQLDYPGDSRWPYPADAKWAKGKQKL